MHIERIELKLGDDKWDMVFHDICFDTSSAIRLQARIVYKNLIYSFTFNDLDHLNRDCQRLATAKKSTTEYFLFGQEKIIFFGDSIYIDFGRMDICIPCPISELQAELKKRFCEPEKPKMPNEFLVGDMLVFCDNSPLPDYEVYQHIGNGQLFNPTSERIHLSKALKDWELKEVYRLGEKIWEAENES